MKLFQTPRGESYVAPPPAIVDPRAGRPASADAHSTAAPLDPSASVVAIGPAAAPAVARPAPAAARSAPAAMQAFEPALLRAAQPPAPAPDTPTRAAPRQAGPTAATAATRTPAAEPGTAPGPSAEPGAPDARPRRPLQPLTIASHQLAIALGRDGEPVPGLARRFPHVLNRISAVWHDPPATAEIIDELLVDRRGGRRGFPADVLAELLTLRMAVVKHRVKR